MARPRFTKLQPFNISISPKREKIIPRVNIETQARPQSRRESFGVIGAMTPIQ